MVTALSVAAMTHFANAVIERDVRNMCMGEEFGSLLIASHACTAFRRSPSSREERCSGHKRLTSGVNMLSCAELIRVCVTSAVKPLLTVLLLQAAEDIQFVKRCVRVCIW